MFFDSCPSVLLDSHVAYTLILQQTVAHKASFLYGLFSGVSLPELTKKSARNAASLEKQETRVEFCGETSWEKVTWNKNDQVRG